MRLNPRNGLLAPTLSYRGGEGVPTLFLSVGLHQPPRKSQWEFFLSSFGGEGWGEEAPMGGCRVGARERVGLILKANWK